MNFKKISKMITKNGYPFDTLISFVKTIDKEAIIDGWEIHPVREIGGEPGTPGATEQCEPEEAGAYGLYIYTNGRGLDWVADLPTEQEAEQLRDLFNLIIERSPRTRKEYTYEADGHLYYFKNGELYGCIIFKDGSADYENEMKVTEFDIPLTAPELQTITAALTA